MPVTAAAARARACGLLLLLACLFCPHFAPRAAAEELLLGVTLNEVGKGVFFAVRTGEFDIFFADEDLHAMGFRSLPGEGLVVAGRPHHSLRAIDGVSYVFDPGAVAVRITAPPALLALKVVDFLAGPAAEVEYPRPGSAFLNYRLTYRDREGSASSFDATGEAGLRSGDVLLLSDAVYRGEAGTGSFVRLMTRASWENRETLERLTLGDFTAAAGDLWGSVSLGGLSFSNVARMDPYQVRHPTFGLTGQAPLPSELRVYLDGVLVRTEQLPPGEFEIRNLDSYGGEKNVEIVIRDAFGREVRLERPFYFTDAVLRAGLHEYSYNAGWVREDFGESSDRYGGPALSAFHRYGLTDACTVGLALEAGGGLASGGPTLSVAGEPYGALSLALSGGRVEGRGEYAFLVAHERQGRRFGTGLRFRRSTAGYRTLFEAEGDDRRNAQLDAEIGYATPAAGSLVLAYRAGWAGPGAARNRLTADYRRGLFGKLSFFATLGHTWEGADRSTDLFTGLSWFLGGGLTASAQHSHRDDADVTSVDVSRDRVSGEGLAWRAAAQWNQEDLTLRPSAEYHGRHGILGGGLTLGTGAGDGAAAVDASVAGALYAAGGHAGIGRPVQDSFALVKVGKDEGLPGVRVYQGGGVQGVTGKDGMLFVPEVSSYIQNQISIEPGDVPLGYSIDRVQRVISPPGRSGTVVDFPAARYQAVAGKLAVREDGALRPMEYLEIGVRAGERSWTVPSGKGGEFFLENVGSGFVTLSFREGGHERSCDLYVPESEDLVVEVGSVSCEFLP